MFNDARLSTLLEWCAENSILIDDRIQIRYHGVETMQQGVFAKDEFIPEKTTLVKIPKSAILSVKTSSMVHPLPQHHVGVAAQLSLSLALYIEILKETRSRFYGYLQSLPSGIVDLPVFWSVNKNCERTSTNTPDYGDGPAALRWLSSTDSGDLLSHKTENGMTLLDEVTFFYHAEALPAIGNLTAEHEAALPPTARPDLLGFYRAFSLVSSRAFLVDAFHGLAMVPVADAFNHVIENSIHLESDYDVCPECGSLDECSHDLDTMPSEKASLCGDEVEILSHYRDQHLEMVSNLAIPPGTEIFNTYGEHLGNAQLLNQYGFILDVNHNDRLKWTLQQIIDTIGLLDVHVGIGSDSNTAANDTSAKLKADVHAVCSTLSDVSAHFPSQLAFFDNEQCTIGDLLYCLNDEGSLSRELWTLLFILSFRHHRKTVSLSGAQTPTTVASSVWRLQIWAEDYDDSDDDNEENMVTDKDEKESQTTSQGTSRNLVPESLLDPLAQSILLQMSGWVVDLCGARKRRIGIPEAWKMDLSDVMEVFTSTHDQWKCTL
ncbi:hypothetical protein D9619_002102 [Psilocybe cf. subviscida]|uniref:SET domain-containing protein n=1 Tax=Psilocybe cf. subviscida TaxID=2480587 RepID=A0A8H5BEZ9_9AGAR|nr:hypothetical protein D9619_002102 [Psilocybe cf. subviscida]